MEVWAAGKELAGAKLRAAQKLRDSSAAGAAARAEYLSRLRAQVWGPKQNDERNKHYSLTAAFESAKEKHHSPSLLRRQRCGYAATVDAVEERERKWHEAHAARVLEARAAAEAAALAAVEAGRACVALADRINAAVGALRRILTTAERYNRDTV
eukprot:390663-Prorocentrum_minimum.AAC.1